MVRRVNLLPSNRLIPTAFCVLFMSASLSAQSASSLRLGPIARSPFVEAPWFALSAAPTSVAAGDLNGDGRLDLVVTKKGSGNVTVLLGDGKGGFGAGVEYPAAKLAGNVLLADVNGDGRLDVVVTDSASGTIAVLAGRGDGTLGSPVSYAAQANPAALALGNFAGKGKIDLAVAGTNGLSVLLNDGAGHFTSGASVPLSVQPRSLTASDLRAAGHDDLVLANQDGTVALLLGDGAGNFHPLSALSVASGPLSAVVAGDFNGDGKPDLAIAATSSNKISILLGHGDGSFAPAVFYAVGNSPVSLVAADVRGSGLIDLVSVNLAANSFSVLLGSGDGTFRPAADFVTGNTPIALAAGDFNGDGHPDLAIINNVDATITVPLGRGDGTFAVSRVYRADLERKAIASGDLNGDGRPDLVVTNYCGSDVSCASNGTATVFLAQQDGTYKAASAFALGNGPVAAALADLNGDKKLDLLALNQIDKSFMVMPGNGDGTFGTPQLYSLSESPRALFVGDFNGDGKPDLAIVSDCGQSTCSQPGSLDIWLGRGDGSLAASASYTVGYSPLSIAAGDLRGTGHPDLVVANSCGDSSACAGDGTGTLLAGDGTGKFTQMGEIDLGVAPSSIALGNLSGGGLDLVVAQRGSNQLALMHANGTGGFTAPVTYSVGKAPSALTIADLNGDGLLDVAVANFQSSTVSVLYGTGTGTLRSAATYPVSSGPDSLAAVTPAKGGISTLVATNGDTGVTPMGNGITALGGPQPQGGTASMTSLMASSASSVVSEPVTLTATVTGGGTTPSGSVAFTVGATFLSDCNGSASDSVNLDGTGTAMCVTQLLPLGSDTVTATYGGDGTYDLSSGTAPVTVTQAATTTTLMSSGTPSTVNDSVTFTATIAAVAPATGSVPFAGSATITFKDGANTLSCPTSTWTPSTGTATCATSSLTAGSHSISAIYSGDPNYGNSTSNSVAQAVNAAGTTVTVNSTLPSSPTVDQTFTITATVAPNPTASISVPFAGTMSFSIDGGAISCSGPTTVNTTTGVATCAVITGSSQGSHQITATYNAGDANYQTSTSPNFPVTTGQAATTASVSASPSSSTVDQSVILTATISPNVTSNEVSTANIVAIAGPVTFADSGTTLSCSNSTFNYASGTATATCTTSALTAGTHSNITATYGGNTSYAASPTSAPASTVTVAKAGTSTTLGSSGATNVNQSVTFTATISAPTTNAAIAITGQVTFTDNGNPITTGTSCGTSGVVTVTGWNAATGQATAICTTSALKGGTHSIIATYGGDGNYSTSNNNVTQTVSAAGTTVAAPTASPSSPNVGQTVTVTATVSSSGTLVVPFSGTMDFFNNGTPVTNCTAITVNTTTGIAQCPVSGLTANTYSITAQYNAGDSSYSQSSVSPALSLTVGTTGITVGLASSSPASTSTVNQSVTFTATMSETVPLTGTITFTDNGSAIAACPTVTMPSSGVATCTDSSLTAGSHSIKAAYSGDSNFTASSNTVAQTVNQAAVVVSVSSSANPSSVNQSVTFTATVTGNPSGSVALSNSGTVTFKDSVTAAAISGCSAVIISVSSGTGTAACTVATLALGAHAITATYNGDSNFATGSGAVSQTVGASTTNITLNASTGASTVNQTVTFTANIPVPTGNTGLVGTVSMTALSSIAGATPTTICSGIAPIRPTTGTNWTAACQDQSLTAAGSPYTITAIYVGDSNFSVGAGVLVQPVNKAATSLAISSSVNPSAVNQSVTFTATLAAPAGPISPTGTVNFTDSVSGTSISGCSSATLTSIGGNVLQATCATATLPLGLHTITAVYGGDSNFSNSNNPVTQSVNAATSSISLGSSLNPYTVDMSATGVTFTATISVPLGSTSLGGRLSFTDTANGKINTICSNVAVSETGTTSTSTLWTGTCPDAALTAGNHTITASYGSDQNFTVSPGNVTQQVLMGTSQVSSVVSSSTINMSVVGTPVTFTATVTPSGGPVALSGSVAFTYAGAALNCSTQSFTAATGIALCTTTSLLPGADTVTATYGGDTNFTSSANTVIQNVQDFSLAASTAPPVIISQGFTTSSDPFTPQTISVAPVSIEGFATQTKPLTLSCSVANSAGTTGTAPACYLYALGTTTPTNPPNSLPVVGSGAQTALSLVVDATTAAPGSYKITVTGTDPTTSLTHVTSFAVTVRVLSPSLQLVSGATTNNSGNVTFLLPAGVTLSNFSCPSLAGSGITAAGGTKPSNFGVACTNFGAPTYSGNTATVQVTITTSNTITTASGATPSRHSDLLVAGVFGIPFFGLIGVLRRKRTRIAFFQLIGMLAIGIAAFQTMGCGGSFHTTATTTSGGTTPPGTYYLLVEGTGSDGNTYEAVLQMNVTIL